MPSTDAYRLSSPAIFLVRMAVFLILVAFVALILHRQIETAFMANPGLNALILLVELFGIVLAVTQVTRLFREIAWVNARVAGPRSPPGRPLCSRRWPACSAAKNALCRRKCCGW